MEDLRKMLNGLKPVILMVMVQIAFAAVNVLYKLAINDGMSMRIATAYRLLFASAFTVPLALVFERNKRPKLTWRVLFMAFLCGLFGGSLFQNLYFEALALTSATFVSAIYNLIPAITFILAISCGFERLSLGAPGGKAKVLGTIIGIGGAMLLTFFKGFEIHIWSFHVNLLHPHHHDQNGVVLTPQHAHSELLGVLCALASCFSYAFWLIIQAKMSGEYPCYLSSTSLMSTMGSIQATVFALCMERDFNQWKLGWNVRLLAVSFAGIAASGMVVIVIAWCVRMRGPMFASAFTPLMLVIVAIAASLTLNEKLYLGSVVGALLIVCGLYVVLWGKGKEMRTMTQLVPSSEMSQQHHLDEPIQVVVTNVSDPNHHKISPEQ
ncbi:WAT1-related protein At1g25270-like [Neltuma alba]|uniref:WAT1-related protein At1g25270-like n=1 Tax=Neltuma alba TaxID=207710 RepID=UPI0010A54DEC|nr:WAT1-related protein At1g25270-like [Prosopis alba]XP_028800984.1 WAT1-related protein At1g25270-like [Prosopis alba]